MANLVTTGAPILDLRWGQETTEREDGTERTFNPKARHQEPVGYLHGGVAAGAVLDAAWTVGAPTDAPTSVAVAFRRPVPLGSDLRVVVRRQDDTTFEATVEHIHDPADEADVIDEHLSGFATFTGPAPAPDFADARELAAMDLPDPERHELFAGCFVCGQDNPEGLQLVPSHVTEDRVVTRVIPDERFSEPGTDRIPPSLMSTLLSCPTLWATAHRLDELGGGGALLADYEVRFHDEPRVSTVLRTVGIEGRPDGRALDQDGGRTRHRLRGLSALIDENGRLYATASGTWIVVDEVPARDLSEPVPRGEWAPLKAGRPEAHSPEDWGQSLPGRREEPGPRSVRPDGARSDLTLPGESDPEDL